MAKLTLDQCVGEEITLQNVAYDNAPPDEGRFNFLVNGKLEAPSEGDPLYHCRVKECYQGTSGVSFGPNHIDPEFGIEQMVSGRIIITLK